MGAVALAAALGGCAGNGHGLDANGNPITPGSGGPEPLTATLQSIQDNIFTPICTRCHIGASAPEGLQLDAAHSYSLLVGVPSTEQPAVLRVNPGNPDISYIVEKLEGAPGISGVQMPFGGPYLPQSTIDVVKQWIAAGAPKGAAAAPSEPTAKQSLSREPQPFNVTASSPDNDSIVSMVLPNIVVAFNGDLDPSLVNTTNISLEQVTTAASIPFAVTIPRGDGAAMLISPRRPLESGIYRVTLHRDLADMNARALGADYTFAFTVDSSQ